MERIDRACIVFSCTKSSLIRQLLHHGLNQLPQVPIPVQPIEVYAAAVSSSSQSVQAQKVNFEAGGAVQLSDQIQLTLNGGLDLAADVSNSYVRGGVSWAF